ncbi:MAG: hypothetical protein GY938_13390, partial [Ketobacter sp.]|nr:hypothetical protein [Ketobacter sp.]
MANMAVKNAAGSNVYLAASGAGSDVDPFVMVRADYHTEVALGNVAARRFMTALGERDTMAVVVTGEDVWRGNELSPAPTSHTSIPHPSASGEQMTVVSEDAGDAAAGTGIRTLRLHYIDAAG